MTHRIHCPRCEECDAPASWRYQHGVFEAYLCAECKETHCCRHEAEAIDPCDACLEEERG